MVVNVSIQYNGGLLPDIILLTLCDYIALANPFNTMKSFCPYSQCSHPNLLTFPPRVNAQEVYMRSDFSLNTTRKDTFKVLSKEETVMVHHNIRKKRNLQRNKKRKRNKRGHNQRGGCELTACGCWDTCIAYQRSKIGSRTKNVELLDGGPRIQWKQKYGNETKQKQKV